MAFRIPPDDRLIAHSLTTSLLGECIAVILQTDRGTSPPLALVRPGIGERVLVRIHSRCTYGDVFGSSYCDCHDQLVEACRRITMSPSTGIVIYLEQEGRGAGLLAKASAYRAFEDRRIDTFTHYSEIGLARDPRDYAEAIDILRLLRVSQLTLLTNNPEKVDELTRAGFDVASEGLIVPTKAEANPYMRSKRENGHLL